MSTTSTLGEALDRVPQGWGHPEAIARSPSHKEEEERDWLELPCSCPSSPLILQVPAQTRLQSQRRPSKASLVRAHPSPHVIPQSSFKCLLWGLPASLPVPSPISSPAGRGSPAAVCRPGWMELGTHTPWQEPWDGHSIQRPSPRPKPETNAQLEDPEQDRTAAWLSPRKLWRYGRRKAACLRQKHTATLKSCQPSKQGTGRGSSLPLRS